MNHVHSPANYLRARKNGTRPTGWRAYERRKAEYVAEHPDATPTAYEQEMQRIARECGV